MVTYNVNLEGKTVLVTGAAGFIGSAVAARLLARGDEVVGLDNLNDYYDPTLKEARLARLARSCGVSRHLLISSCDVYGQRPGQSLNELTPPHPLTRHAHGVLHTEAAVLPLAGWGLGVFDVLGPTR